jgi:hypothetical protein
LQQFDLMAEGRRFRLKIEHTPGELKSNNTEGRDMPLVAGIIEWEQQGPEP